jgi:hypothetical protein
MKGRLFSATLLVLVLVLMLAVPASAGKPPPPPGDITITVGRWSYKQIGNTMADAVTARNITWSNASAANYLVNAIYTCDVGTAPGPELDTGCITWTDVGSVSITELGKLRSRSFEVGWSDCHDYFPAILLVHVYTDGTTTQMLARDLGSKIAGYCP